MSNTEGHSELTYAESKVMRTNFDAKLRKPSKMSDISNQTNFLRIFEAAIVLPFAKNRANP